MLLFLAALAVWLGDETPGQEHTRRFLERRLADADRGMAVFSAATARQAIRTPTKDRILRPS